MEYKGYQEELDESIKDLEEIVVDLKCLKEDQDLEVLSNIGNLLKSIGKILQAVATLENDEEITTKPIRNWHLEDPGEN